MKQKNPYFYTNILAWGLVLFLIGNYVFGWTTPTANPPSSNLPAPINASLDPQTKAGNLTIGGVLRLGQFATANAPSGTEGALYFNTTEKKIKVYSNTAWGDLGGGVSLWTASGTAAAFDQDVYVGGALYVQGQRVICPAGQGGTDSYCNYVCTDYYVQTGTEGVESTEYCYNKTALTSANCGAVGGCKASDYTNCNSQANGTIQYECGLCKYIDAAVCVNNIKGSCSSYANLTSCGSGLICRSGVCGGAYCDEDNDGHYTEVATLNCPSGRLSTTVGDDCNDACVTCYPGSTAYTTSADGLDQDCDGSFDEIAYIYNCTSNCSGASAPGWPCTQRCAYIGWDCPSNNPSYGQFGVNQCESAVSILRYCQSDTATTCYAACRCRRTIYY